MTKSTAELQAEKVALEKKIELERGLGLESPVDARVPREAITRESEQRMTEWRPAPLLPEPVRQEGYDYAYKRITYAGEDDARNIASFRSEGWEPVRREEQPQMFLVPNEKSFYKDFVEIGGLLLCKTPTKFVEQRNAYYANVTRQQMESVDNTLMRENDKRMPLFSERRTATTTGSRPTV